MFFPEARRLAVTTLHELEQASREGSPVILIRESGAVHYADKAFVRSGALIIFEMGWTDPIRVPNPVHVVTGGSHKSGEGLWRWPGAEARIVSEDFFLEGEWADWKSGDWVKNATWERAEELVQRLEQGLRDDI